MRRDPRLGRELLIKLDCASIILCVPLAHLVEYVALPTERLPSFGRLRIVLQHFIVERLRLAIFPQPPLDRRLFVARGPFQVAV